MVPASVSAAKHQRVRCEGGYVQPSIDAARGAWYLTVGGLRKLRHRGGPLVTWIFTFTAAVYTIVRLRRLLPATA